MAQRIIVQDGKVLYSASDPSNDVDFNVAGVANITKQVNVGNDPLASGVIQTPDDSGVDLIFRTNTDGLTNGNIRLEPITGGSIVLNNTVWPDGTVSPNSGMFLGATGLNTLQFRSFVIGSAGVDTMTQSQLNIAYPSATAGQMVTGVTVLYQCVGASQWRILGGSLGYDPVNKAGDTMSGYLILNADPVTDLGAATKQYVDSVAAGLNIHAAARVATNATLDVESGGTTTYDNGFGGVGATITTTGTFATISTIALSAGDRILVKNEALPAFNGVYVYTSSTVLTRADDFDGSPTSEIEAGDFVYVREGLLEGTSWVQTSLGPLDIGTDDIIFDQFSGPVASQALTINTQASDYTIQLTDAYNTLIRITKGTPALVTIENDGVIDMPIGSCVLISWNGAGSVTIAPAVGVTVDSPDSLSIGKQFGKITAIKVGANHWEIEGNLAP